MAGHSRSTWKNRPSFRAMGPELVREYESTYGRPRSPNRDYDEPDEIEDPNTMQFFHNHPELRTPGSFVDRGSNVLQGDPFAHMRDTGHDEALQTWAQTGSWPAGVPRHSVQHYIYTGPAAAESRISDVYVSIHAQESTSGPRIPVVDASNEQLLEELRRRARIGEQRRASRASSSREQQPRYLGNVPMDEITDEELALWMQRAAEREEPVLPPHHPLLLLGDDATSADNLAVSDAALRNEVEQDRIDEEREQEEEIGFMTRDYEHYEFYN